MLGFHSIAEEPISALPVISVTAFEEEGLTYTTKVIW